MARAPARRSPALSFVVGLAGAIAFEGGFLRLAFAERLPVPPEFLPSPAVAGAAFVLGAALVLAGALLHQR